LARRRQESRTATSGAWVLVVVGRKAAIDGGCARSSFAARRAAGLERSPYHDNRSRRRRSNSLRARVACVLPAARARRARRRRRTSQSGDKARRKTDHRRAFRVKAEIAPRGSLPPSGNVTVWRAGQRASVAVRSGANRRRCDARAQLIDAVDGRRRSRRCRRPIARVARVQDGRRRQATRRAGLAVAERVARRVGGDRRGRGGGGSEYRAGRFDALGDAVPATCGSPKHG